MPEGAACLGTGASLVFELMMQKRRLTDDVAFLQDIHTVTSDLGPGAELTRGRVEALMKAAQEEGCGIRSPQVTAVRSALDRVDAYVQARKGSSFAGVAPTVAEALVKGGQAMIGISAAVAQLTTTGRGGDEPFRLSDPVGSGRG